MTTYPTTGGMYNGVAAPQVIRRAGNYAQATPEGQAAMRGNGSLLGQAADWWNNKNAPQIGANPYQGGWDALLAQLQQQANGQGPSLAGEAYKQAQQQGMQNVLAMSRGGSAGAARAGMQNLGQMNQGMAQGYSNARLQEQLAARQQLQAALAGAGNAWFQPQQMNLQAQMATPSNGQQLTSFVSQLASSFAPFMTGAPTAAQAPGAAGGGYAPSQNPNVGTAIANARR